jgi:hypothetical protein
MPHPSFKLENSYWTQWLYSATWELLKDIISPGNLHTANHPAENSAKKLRGYKDGLQPETLADGKDIV